jgi:hypothetical protein
MRILLGAVALVAVPALASAQEFKTYREPGVTLGAEAGGAFLMGDGSDAFSTGYQFLGRFGYEFGMGLTPELAIDYGHWGAGVTGADYSLYQVSVLPGLRWSVLAGTLRPWAAFHVGYGHWSVSGTGVDVSDDGLAFNTGGGCDFMLTSGMGFGLHFTYNKITTDQGTGQGGTASGSWLDIGAGFVATL